MSGMETSPARVTPDQYFALDAASEARIEYYDGVTLAMAGASPRHNRIASNVHVALRRALDPRGCYVAQSDQRTQLSSTRAWVYPDLVASCEPRFDGAKPQSLTNPELVVEVLSSSTGDHDLGAKLSHYRATESIVEVVFVRVAERLVEHHRRLEPSKWLVTLVRTGTVELTGIGVSLEVDEIYGGLDRLPSE
jgi:Uma2 family endonuclease